MKNLTLEKSGLIIELFDAKRTYVTYSACTHGGWAKYIGESDGIKEPVAHFDNKSEVIADANSIAKYYNNGLLVLI